MMGTHKAAWLVTAALLLVACASGGDAPPALDGGLLDGSLDASARDASTPDASTDASTPDAGTDGSPADSGMGDAGMPPDPCLGLSTCDGIEVTSFPFVDTGDTTLEGSDVWDGYSCSSADESGPEVVYVVDVEEVGLLGVRVVDGDGVDIDVHVLDAADADACLGRHDSALSTLVGPGRHYVVADTYVAGGEDKAGEYTITIRFLPVPLVDCATDRVDLPMFWTSCDASLDCVEMDDGTGTLRPHLMTPTTGPVVNEAHLVAVDDVFEGWPTSARDQLEGHYALSEELSNFVAPRSEPWAPAGEGGSRWGQGSTSVRVPTDAEGWYINMYWRRRPAGGTRMLVRNPLNGRVVVAAAGYETGPGANTRIGGVVEEVHSYLASGHLDDLEIGFLSDPTVPLGPVRCR